MLEKRVAKSRIKCNLGPLLPSSGHIRRHVAATRAYVTNEDSSTVSVIDTATNIVVATIPVGGFPFGVAITPAPQVPASREQCEHGGYLKFGPPAGPFKNQRQCVSRAESLTPAAFVSGAKHREFQSAEASVRCASQLSRALRKQTGLELRMGIHTGPVYRVADINANRNVAGGGINIAQRVMDCGDAGHILLSSAVADVLRQVSVAWSNSIHDLGEAEVKHGVRVHLYNLYTEEVGNVELPQKLRTAQKAAANDGIGCMREPR